MLVVVLMTIEMLLVCAELDTFCVVDAKDKPMQAADMVVVVFSFVQLRMVDEIQHQVVEYPNVP
jgi:hypothetical protein